MHMQLAVHVHLGTLLSGVSATLLHSTYSHLFILYVVHPSTVLHVHIDYAVTWYWCRNGIVHNRHVYYYLSEYLYCTICQT